MRTLYNVPDSATRALNGHLLCPDEDGAPCEYLTGAMSLKPRAQWLRCKVYCECGAPASHHLQRGDPSIAQGGPHPLQSVPMRMARRVNTARAQGDSKHERGVYVAKSIVNVVLRLVTNSSVVIHRSHKESHICLQVEKCCFEPKTVMLAI